MLCHSHRYCLLLCRSSHWYRLLLCLGSFGWGSPIAQPIKGMKWARSARLALASVCPLTAVPQVGANRCGWHFFISSRNTEILPTDLGPRWVMGLFLPTVWLAEFPLPKIQMHDNIATKTWDAFVLEKVPTTLLALFFGTWFPNLTSILSTKKSKMYVLYYV